MLCKDSPYKRSKLKVVPSLALRLTAAGLLLSARACAMKSSTLCTLISASSKSVRSSSEPRTCRWSRNLCSVKVLDKKCHDLRLHPPCTSVACSRHTASKKIEGREYHDVAKRPPGQHGGTLTWHHFPVKRTMLVSEARTRAHHLQSLTWRW